MSGSFDIGGCAVAFEEKRAWIMLVVSAVAYTVYVAIVLGGRGGVGLTEVSYAPALLWTVGAAIVAAIALSIAADVTSPRGAAKRDQRDQEIGRLGDHVGQSFVVIGGVAALFMAMSEVDYFWIANVIYLTFVLSAVLGSVTKIVAYRRGFQEW
jgi:hypothetical protein